MKQRVVEHLREALRFAPVKPAVMAGLRTAIATVLPLVVATTLHFSEGLWLCVGGFNASFADRGGSYGSRARSMLASLLACALGVSLGGLAGRHPALAIAVALLWVTACSFAGVYGAAANVVGNGAASAFVISLALPAAGGVESLERGALLALGALWAMMLSLVLWPIRPYGPARLAVAQSFREVADYARAMGRLRGGAEELLWQGLILGHHGRIRESLEVAGSTLAATRRGRGERQRGEQLLSLLQMMDATFGTVIALGDALESLGSGSWALLERGGVERTLGAFADTLQQLARGIETEAGLRTPPSLDWGADVLQRLVQEEPALDVVERAQCLHALRLIARLREYAAAAVETATRLSGAPLPPESQPPAREDPLLGPVRENLTPRSMVFRHALRVGLTTTVAVWVSSQFIPSHGYWVTITVLTVLQPYTGSTFLKGVQRILGTVVGGLLAVVVAAGLHNSQALLGLVFLTAAASIALIPLNYALFTVFLTLTFVLLAEMGSGDWNLARVRVLNTLVGGALALVGSWVLWERSEKELLPEQMAEALKANREFFLQVFAGWLGTGAGVDASLLEARRKIGLASLNAEASFQRLLSEPRRRTEPIEPLMTLLAYMRRFTTAVVALSSSPREQTTERARAYLERFSRRADGVLGDLIDAVARGRMPSPLPDLQEPLDWSPEERLLQSQLARVVRQLTVLHAAASRRGGLAPLEAAPETVTG